MKRLIKAASMDPIGEAVSKVSAIVEDYFVEHEGLTKEAAHDYFEVHLRNLEDGVKEIHVNAELSYDEFSSIAPDLNEAVQKADEDAYFDAITSGRYVCVLETIKNPEDPIFNKKNVQKAADFAINRVNESLGTNFAVDDVYINMEADYDENGYPVIEMLVGAYDDNAVTYAKYLVSKDEVSSAHQLVEDLKDYFYSMFINNVHED